jgi:hypothetical protein
MPGQASPLVFVSRVNFGIQQSAQCSGEGGRVSSHFFFLFLVRWAIPFVVLHCILFTKGGKDALATIFGLSFFLSIYVSYLRKPAIVCLPVLLVLSEKAGNCSGNYIL